MAGFPKYLNDACIPVRIEYKLSTPGVIKFDACLLYMQNFGVGDPCKQGDCGTVRFKARFGVKTSYSVSLLTFHEC